MGWVPGADGFISPLGPVWLAKQGETSWPPSRMESDRTEEVVGLERALECFYSKNLFLQRKTQRTPLLAHLLLPGKVTPLNIIFPAPKKQIILTFGWRHWLSQSCCLCWTSDVSSLEIMWWTTSYHGWVMASEDQGQRMSLAKGNTESCCSRCVVRLKRASLWA